MTLEDAIAALDALMVKSHLDEVEGLRAAVQDVVTAAGVQGATTIGTVGKTGPTKAKMAAWATSVDQVFAARRQAVVRAAALEKARAQKEAAR